MARFKKRFRRKKRTFRKKKVSRLRAFRRFKKKVEACGEKKVFTGSVANFRADNASALVCLN